MRATEAAALAASRHLGRGDKEIVDQAAVDAMRPVLNTISMRGTVVIGEGEKDEAPMLYNGEDVGDGTGPEVDFAVDPVDGTTLTAKSLPNALAIVAVSERHTMFDPGPCVYMEKIAVAGDLADVIDFNAPIETTLAHIAKARGVPVPGAHGVHPRPAAARGGPRPAGPRGGLADQVPARRRRRRRDHGRDPGHQRRPHGRHRRHPRGRARRVRAQVPGRRLLRQALPPQRRRAPPALDAGYDLDKVLTLDDMVRSNNVFVAATGVTDGELLRGVRFSPDQATTHSLSMRSLSGAVRLIETRHRISTSNLVPR